MKLTPKLKAWLEKNAGVASGSDDDAYMKAAVGAVMKGTLTPDLQKELTIDEDANKATRIEDMLGQILDNQKSQQAEIEALKAGKLVGAGVGETSGGLRDVAPEFPEGVKELIGSEKGGSDPAIRLKGAHEQYDDTKTAACYPETTLGGRKSPRAGQPLVLSGNYEGATARNINLPTQLDKAICGVFFKVRAYNELGGRAPSLTDHEKALWDYAVHEAEWGGAIGSNKRGSDDGALAVFKEPTKLKSERGDFTKNVIDDAVSGGLEAAPIAFDDAIITFPLLNGELFPYVNLVTVDRGRRMEGVTMQNVTLTWGDGDSSGGADWDQAAYAQGVSFIPLFNTAGFIAAFDTVIHPVTGSIKIGKDFLSDSPIAIGAHVQQSYGQRFLEELDRVIAIGSGVNEPLGVMNGIGTTVVTTANGVGGAPTVGDYESLLFAIPKQYMSGHPDGSARFAANQVTYQRAKGIPVGAADARRVFGMNHEDYRLLEHPYSIHHGMANNQGFFGVMPRYRMYRRLGMTIDVEDRGETLKRGNNILICCRGRFGGQIEDGNAFATTVTHQNP